MKNELYVGVDVGGTKISAALVDKKGTIIRRGKFPTEVARGSKAVLSNIKKAITSVWSDGVVGIGLGLAGHVDHAKGIYVQGPNLPRTFRNVPLAKMLSATYGVKVALDNDVRCFLMGEFVAGAARGKRHVVGITIGTGIGGSIIIDGQPYRGRDNAAGEVGHWMMSLGSLRTCGCGHRGHWEALGSGSAMRKRYEELSGNKSGEPSEFAALAKAGDAAAKTALNEAAEAIGAGLAGIAMAFNPDLIVIGGGVARDKHIWKPAMAALRRHVTFKALGTTPVVMAKLRGDANLIGAATLVQDRR